MVTGINLSPKTIRPLLSGKLLITETVNTMITFDNIIQRCERWHDNSPVKK